MNSETKKALKARISEIDAKLIIANEAFEKAKAEKQKAVAIFNTCQEEVFNLNTEKNKIKEDLPPNA
jgi:hypothetical protein